MFRGVILALAAAHAASAQTDFGQGLLGQVRQHVAATFASLPYYTCQETMDRSVYSPASQVTFRERLRLDVLVSSRGELFAWPGSTGFSTDAIDHYIKAGAIGSGNFSTEIHNLFQASSPTVKYAGLETHNQQPVYRFDFYAPLLSSKYVLNVNGKSAITAYSGSFWVDKQSLDLDRLDTRAEAIPPDLDCREAHESVTYGRVRIGDADQLLPSVAELAIISRGGQENRDSVVFSECRHYTAETSLSFSTDSNHPPRAQPPNPLRLPPGISIALRLDQAISAKDSAVGDPIVALVDKAVKSSTMYLPKGTRVLGRIRRLEQHFGPDASTLVGLEFFSAETSDGRSNVSARLIGPQGSPDVVRSVGLDGSQELVHGTPGLHIEDDGASTGIGIFRVPGKEFFLARGFRTLWETQ